ncbi:MAG TPA: tRNA (adenosine(37)-N6)-threonylcarbamoyltransferase complex ATPase subunit type 1 TsaE [Aestuariivirgaceae bacterium]|nr:tRNA (adenosine(37)-N6)-threonylcarbamoyltransferase complex ATPase subunit type 1 TsaE [Aestuariivirgaceae bacterium]
MDTTYAIADPSMPHAGFAMTSDGVIRILTDEGATAGLARELALFVRPGDCLAISGDLGSGKTALARALIQALSPQGDSLEVPSPTFTLVQTYDARIPVAHFDFYRLNDATELAETGFDEFAESHVTLVEWADRLPGELPDDRLEIALEVAGTGRRARLFGHGAWTGKLARMEAVRNFLLSTQWADARRLHLNGDASIRRYERLVAGEGRTAVLMDMPARPDGPAIRNGRSYSAIAHLAEDCSAVVAVNAGLRDAGLSAPELYAADLKQGFLIIEDFGDELYGRMLADGEDVSEAMAAAVDLLAYVAERDWPAAIPLPDGTDHRIARYDDDAVSVEVSLLPDWFWPLVKGEAIPRGLRDAFEAAWAQALPAAHTDASVWMLRDYHSPNLVWLPERSGIERVGLLDVQDCVFGHPAYDLASLLQDARVDIAAALASSMFKRYCATRQSSPRFDRAGFEAAYAVLGAQRATKILGIFARLSRRDGKHQYLRHLPRVSRTLEANLAHPALAPVRQWFDRHLPLNAREAAVQRLLRTK